MQHAKSDRLKPKKNLNLENLNTYVRPNGNGGVDLMNDGPGAWIFATPDGGTAWTLGPVTFDATVP